MKRKLLCLLLILVLVLTAVTAVACDDDKPIVLPEGPESGVYYTDAVAKGDKLTLSNGNEFALVLNGENLAGTYTVDGGKLAFVVEGGAEFTATLEGNLLQLLYKANEYTLYKDVNYTVSFDVNGGDAVASQTVANGGLATKPANATKEGFAFIGWFADKACTEKFNFAGEITADTTVYAYFIEVSVGEEFTINFAEADMEEMTTIAGKLYNVADPAEKDGFTFGGWWISMYNDADKLSYQFVEGETVFNQNTTLFPLWLSDESLGSKLATPIVEYADGMLSWNAQTGVSEYAIVVEGPTGFETIEATTGASTYAVDLANAPAGDYTFFVTAKASVEANDSDPAELYYVNKGLAQVSLFSVSADADILLFNKVANATNYLITVECGDANHAHTDVDLGDNNAYDFSACEMKVGGIKFTLTATAEGYASSTATYVFDRTLEAATGLNVANELLTWEAVEGATGYTLTINDGETTTVKLGDELSYDLQHFNPAENGVVITITASAKGYNDSAATSYTYNKTTLATASNVAIESTNVVWDAVEGATEYQIYINDKLYVSNTNKLAWPSALGTNDEAYTIKIKAVGATESLWGEYQVEISALPTGLTYTGNTFSWNGVLGAENYQYKVDGGSLSLTTKNFGKIAFTNAGENTLMVRSFVGGEYSEWVTITVDVYEVMLDGASYKLDKLYLAVGDEFAPEQPSETGYTFAGWYMNEQSQGASAQYDEENWVLEKDTTLFAHWTAKTYSVTLSYENGTGFEGTADVTYNSEFTFENPGAALENGKSFIGWYTMKNGEGIRYTDELAESARQWRIDNDTTLYAYWGDVLKYDELENGTWSVTQGEEVDLVNVVTIPGFVDDIRVTVVDGYAFSRCSYLKEVMMPDTIEIVEGTAFNDSDNIENVNVYAIEGNKDVYYSSIDGVLFYHDEITTDDVISYFPVGKAGEYTIPDFVTYIPNGLFENCSSLTKIVIPTSVTEIGNKAFASCSDLAEIEFVEGGDAKLVLGDELFRYCSSLVAITLPARVSEISEGAFKYSHYIENVFVGENGTNFADADGVLYTADLSKLVYYPVNKTGEVVLSEGLKIIGANSFYGCEFIEINIPASVELIEKGAFDNFNSTIQKVVFKGVEDNQSKGLVMGDELFYNNGSLNTVIFEEGSNVTEIGSKTFDNCSMLSVITLPDTLVKIGANAFERCVRIGDLVIPGSVVSIGNGAYKECTNIESVTIKEGDEIEFGSDVFANCDNLLAVYMPKTVKVIDGKAFNGCEALKGIYVDDENPYYEDVDGVLFTKGLETLLYCSPVREGNFVIPAAVKHIGDNVFYGNENITEITISANIESIGSSAFYGCTSLETITFADGGTEQLTIDFYAFRGCSALTEIALPNRVVVAEHVKDETIPSLGWFWDCEKLTTVTLPDSLTEIGESMFRYCDALTTVNMPANVTKINSWAFQGCKALTDIEIPEAVTQLGLNVFNGCTTLTEMTIPSDLTNYIYEKKDGTSTEYGVINTGLFYGCSALTTVTFSEGFVDLALGTNVFYNCSSLTTVNLPTSLETLDIGDKAFYSCKKLAAFAVPANVTSTSIGEGAFYYCSALTTVEFVNVTTLEDDAFKSCTSLTSAKFTGEELRYVGDSAFYGCSKLATVELPDCVGAIGASAFYNCKLLANFEMPTNLQNIPGASSYTRAYMAIGDKAFYGCSSLTSAVFSDDAVFINDTEADYPVAELGFTIGGSAFYGCTKLTEVYLPAHLGMVKTGSYASSNKAPIGTDAFDGCTSLENIEVAEGNEFFRSDNGILYQLYKLVSYLPQPGDVMVFLCPVGKTGAVEISADAVTVVTKAFDGCKKITSVTFAEDSQLTSFGTYAFQYCTALESVEIPATVKTLGSSLFARCSALKNVTFLTDGDGETALTTVSSSAFSYCTSLVTVKLPDSVTSVASGSFTGSSKITSIYIPDSLNVANLYLFSGLSYLTEITVSSNNTNYSVKNNILYSLDGTKLIYAPLGIKGELEIENGVTEIGNKALYSHTGITSVVLPSGLEKIGEYAFYKCKLTTVTIPASVTNIEKSAFASCTSLLEVNFDLGTDDLVLSNGVFDGCTKIEMFTLPARVVKINERTFDDTDALDTIVFEAGSRLTEIANYSFYSSGIKYIEFPSTITSIGSSAFRACASLHTVTFAEGSKLESISTGAFQDNVGLNSITLPETLTEIGNDAFNKTSLGEIVIPESVEDVGDGVFENCTILKTAKLPAKLDSLGDGVFKGCILLEEVNIPAGITYIDYSMFEDCKSLTEITIPEGINEIGDSAFENCTNLAVINLPSTLEEVGEYTFAYTAIASLTLPEGVEMIPYGLFAGCSSLETFVMPSSVTAIDDGGYSGKGAFYGCSSLTSIVIPEGVTALDCYYASWQKTYITSAKYGTFEGCTSLTDVTLPSTLVGLGGFTFKDCTSLENIELNIGLEHIFKNAFDGCTSLEAIEIPSSVKEIGDYAFKNCAKLPEIYIPGDVEKLGTSPFYGCEGLTGFELSSNNTSFAVVEGVLYNYERDEILAFPTSKQGTFTYPETIFEIEPYAFAGCTGLNEIILHRNIAEIPEGAFQNCTGLTSVVIPNGIEKIGEKAFEGCTNLVNVTLPDSLEYLYKSAFAGCTSIKEIEIPSEIISAYSFAFYGCTGLEKVTFNFGTRSVYVNESMFEGCTSLTTVEFGANPNELGVTIMANAFKDCTNLNSFEFLPTLGKIGDYAFANTALTSFTAGAKLLNENDYSDVGEGAFMNCDKLATIDLGNIQRIGVNTFAGCTSLTEVTIPKYATYLAAYAFDGCTGLTEVFIPADVSMGNAFTNCSGITEFKVDENNTKLSCVDGAIYNSAETTIFAVPAGKVGAVTILDTVTSINGAAFLGCEKLTSVTLPTELKTMYASPFADCKAVTAFTIAEDAANYKTVDGVLYNKAGTELYAMPAAKTGEFTTPAGVNKIYAGAFAHSSLTTITLSADVTTVRENAFTGLTSAQTINVPAFVAAPIGWSTDWNADCAATINWKAEA